MSFLCFEAISFCLTAPNALFHKDFLQEVCQRAPKIMIEKVKTIDDRSIRDVRKEQLESLLKVINDL